jgi:hypothetical protein
LPVRKTTVAAALASLVLPAAAIATARACFWTESYAEAIVVKRVHIPCTRVRPKKACDVNAARKRLQYWKQKGDQCNQSSDVPRCLVGAANQLASAEPNYRYARYGFGLESADCIGAGLPDKSSVRFSQFRCKILFEEQRLPPLVGTNGEIVSAGQTVLHSGRIVVYVTGQTTFRWALI